MVHRYGPQRALVRDLRKLADLDWVEDEFEVRAQLPDGTQLLVLAAAESRSGPSGGVLILKLMPEQLDSSLPNWTPPARL